MAAPHPPTNRRPWQPSPRPSALLLILLLFGIIAQACDLKIVELDPSWPDGSTTERTLDREQSPPDREPPTHDRDSAPPEEPQLKEEIPEDLPETPATCTPATSRQMSLTSALPKEGKVMLYGTLDQNTNAEFKLAVPSDWNAEPGSVMTDAEGRYGFLISRQKERESRGTIYLYNNDICLSLRPRTTDDKLQNKRLELPSSPICQAGTTTTLTVEVKGDDSSTLLIRSTAPDFASFRQLQRTFDQGRTIYDIDIDCHKAGSVLLLIGSLALSSTSLALMIQ